MRGTAECERQFQELVAVYVANGYEIPETWAAPKRVMRVQVDAPEPIGLTDLTPRKPVRSRSL